MIEDMDKHKFLKRLNELVENGVIDPVDDKDAFYEEFLANSDKESKMFAAMVSAEKRQKILNIVGFYLFIFVVVMFSTLVTHKIMEQ